MADEEPVQDAVPSEAVVPLPRKRGQGLRNWWRDGSAESSTPKSSVGGAIIGVGAATAVCAYRTGHTDTALAIGDSVLPLCMIWLWFLWWALERPKVGLSAMAAGAVPAALLVLLVWGPLPTSERDLAPAWKTASERPIGTRAVGSWATGNVVVRVRPDLVTAYRAMDGSVAWTWTPPGQDVVCAMSRATGQGVGLLSHAAHNEPCGNAVALDLATGNPRWTATIQAPIRGGDPAAPDLLAVAGSSAVLQGSDGWRAVGLADGHDQWHSSAGQDCTPLLVAGGSDTAVTVSRCGTQAPVLRSFAVADGHEVLHTALPVGTDLTHLGVLSTAPLTVWVEEGAARGTHAVIAFDDAGHARTTIPVVDEYTLDVTLGGPLTSGFAARPAYGAVVVDGLLLVPAEKPDGSRITVKTRTTHGRVVAYSLTDGSKRWTADLSDRVTGLAVDGGSVWALTSDGLAHIDAATGAKLLDRRNGDGLGQSLAGDLWVVGDRYVFVNRDGTDGNAPVYAFH